jgi:Asp-tRNA(Asn)/Glu-tRNA(Gln) amidotransferase A subunit family amidase
MSWMNANDLHYLSVAEAASLIESGRLSPVEYTSALLARIERLDRRVRAFRPEGYL